MAKCMDSVGLSPTSLPFIVSSETNCLISNYFCVLEKSSTCFGLKFLHLKADDNDSNHFKAFF